MKLLIRQLIEALHGKQQCPRLVVDATLPGVLVPDRVKKQWGDAMPIDLDPNYPLDLRMQDDGLHCSLSFGGPFDCFFPWASIYVVQDRESQLGLVIQEHVPGSWRVLSDERGRTMLAPQDQTRPVLATTESTRREGNGNGSGRQHLQLVNPDALESPDPATIEHQGTVTTARSRFRVIDGGRDQG